MLTRHNSARQAVALAAALAMGSIASMSLAQMATDSPTTMPTAAPTTSPAGRTLQDVMQDVQGLGREIMTAMGSQDTMFDTDKRAVAAPKVIPSLKKLAGYGAELSGMTDDQAKSVGTQISAQANFMLALFGDEEAKTAVDKMTKSTDAKEASRGKSMQFSLRWLQNTNNPAEQLKVLDETIAAMKASPDDKEMGSLLQQYQQFPASSPEVSAKLKSAAEEVASTMPPKSLEKKALEIAGTQPDGKKFTTADWKGKVVLVDFWATWCGPCLAELPRVKKAYADFHAKGLEVLGVSNDFTPEALTTFVAKDPGMPWPQLFDAAAASKHEWNPITMGYGIDGIPTMFLIDKKGVVRTVDARENFEELIPKMLEESD